MSNVPQPHEVLVELAKGHVKRTVRNHRSRSLGTTIIQNYGVNKN